MLTNISGRNMKQKHKKVEEWQMIPMGLALIFFWAIALMPSGVMADVPDEDCAACHDEVSEAFLQTAHGNYIAGSTYEGNQCESCHGSGNAHVEDGDPDLIQNPGKWDSFAEQETCLTCHSGQKMSDWAFSGHRNSGVTCADCHKVHVPTAKGVAKVTPDACYECHSDVRAETYMPSHHPIVEGKIDCVDCHNPHGGSVTLAMDDSGRELCFSCHADKEGPHVYEHAPVSEDCMICHSPHGTVANNLLKVNEPALCLNCHSMHFHATVESVDGDFSTPQAPERASSSTPDGFKMGMLTKCTQCHTGIHGSDSPSQAISTGGNALTH